MIQEIFSEANYGVRFYEETDEPYNSYIIYCYLRIYGIPDDLTDDEEEEIYNGEIGKAVQLGNVKGLLILGTQAAKTGMNIYDICDCTDADAEFIYSALQEGDGPLAYEPYLDIFFIKSIDMCDGFNTDELKLRIIDCLPQFLLRCYHTYPDIIAAYPQPLPFEKSIHQKIKEGMAIEISVLYLLCFYSNNISSIIPKNHIAFMKTEIFLVCIFIIPFCIKYGQPVDGEAGVWYNIFIVHHTNSLHFYRGFCTG